MEVVANVPVVATATAVATTFVVGQTRHGEHALGAVTAASRQVVELGERGAATHVAGDGARVELGAEHQARRTTHTTVDAAAAAASVALERSLGHGGPATAPDAVLHRGRAVTAVLETDPGEAVATTAKPEPRGVEHVAGAPVPAPPETPACGVDDGAAVEHGATAEAEVVTETEAVAVATGGEEAHGELVREVAVGPAATMDTAEVVSHHTEGRDQLVAVAVAARHAAEGTEHRVDRHSPARREPAVLGTEHEARSVEVAAATAMATPTPHTREDGIPVPARGTAGAARGPATVGRAGRAAVTVEGAHTPARVDLHTSPVAGPPAAAAGAVAAALANDLGASFADAVVGPPARPVSGAHGDVARTSASAAPVAVQVANGGRLPAVTVLAEYSVLQALRAVAAPLEPIGAEVVVTWTQPQPAAGHDLAVSPATVPPEIMSEAGADHTVVHGHETTSAEVGAEAELPP
mmetsp:Transcript_16589/g.39003  ORF Transcript_16589/g.39003 Transcript_16589/m.39003 type:complete len:467 (+) Transcript_16589:3232-4632(+)